MRIGDFLSKWYTSFTQALQVILKLYTSFTSDTQALHKLYTSFTSDTQALQNNIDQLATWASQWQLDFNADKCEALRISHKRDQSVPS